MHLLETMRIIAVIVMFGFTTALTHAQDSVIIPLQIGNAWTYEGNWLDSLLQPQSEGWTWVEHIDKDSVIAGSTWFREGYSRLWMTNRDDGVWVLLWWKQEHLLAPFPDWPDKEFRHPFLGTIEEFHDSTVVSTPAGTFVCRYFRFQREMGIAELWYCANVGLVLSRSRRKDIPSSISEHKLVSFSLR
jgi:hypothetical protein